MIGVWKWSTSWGGWRADAFSSRAGQLDGRMLSTEKWLLWGEEAANMGMVAESGKGARSGLG